MVRQQATLPRIQGSQLRYTCEVDFSRVTDQNSIYGKKMRAGECVSFGGMFLEAKKGSAVEVELPKLFRINANKRHSVGILPKGWEENDSHTVGLLLM